jgi:four helix bundle protein
MGDELEFDTWAETVPKGLKEDPLWKSRYYQLAMYLYDMAWQDCGVMKKDYRGREVGRQLIRSAGGIAANMEEGYGRGIGTQDHRRIMRIALGEARETQGWYHRSRHLLPKELLAKRLDLINQIVSLLVRAISPRNS